MERKYENFIDTVRYLIIAFLLWFLSFTILRHSFDYFTRRACTLTIIGALSMICSLSFILGETNGKKVLFSVALGIYGIAMTLIGISSF